MYLTFSSFFNSSPCSWKSPRLFRILASIFFALFSSWDMSISRSRIEVNLSRTALEERCWGTFAYLIYPMRQTPSMPLLLATPMRTPLSPLTAPSPSTKSTPFLSSSSLSLLSV